MRDLKRGAQLAGRYTLVRKLGAGRGVEIWLGNDRLTGASVALKILVADIQTSDMLRREWRLNIRLMHAHIVRAFEFHDEEQGAIYSMQYIEGPDIGVLTGAAVGEILPPIASLVDALRYIHDKQIVHRDIKASNVLLDSNGAPYLTDFGVAAIIDNDDGDALTSDIGGGSVISASPQLLDGKAAHPSDDIFALGGLIYELISGRPPYSSAQIEDDIRHFVPPPMTAANGDDIPASVQRLVAAMLEKEAFKRPDATSISAWLKDTDIRPGLAPSKYVASTSSVRDEVIESEAATQRQKPIAHATESRDLRTRGLNSRVVAFGLTALLTILLAVIFLLPKTVTDDRSGDSAESKPAEVTDSQSMQNAEPVGLPQRDERVQARNDTDRILGELLSIARTLEGRAVQRWGGLPYKRAQEVYAAGDEAYLARNYALASENYQRTIELLSPLLNEVDTVFESTLAEAQLALDNADTDDAVRLFELAVAISPSHAPSLGGLARAKNLDTVLSLTEQGLAHERDLELDAAKRSLERAIEIDPQWKVANVGLERVLATINQMEFDARMTEGLAALDQADYPAARAAFRMAQELQPDSSEPGDGLQQVDQGVRLGNIGSLQRQAESLEAGERWSDAIDTYKSILELDGDLTFAQDGLVYSAKMSALHKQLDDYIDDPDSLSAPRTMQTATQLVVDITRMEKIGARLAEQRDQLSSLLKRAATPLTVQIVSDNQTDVSIYKVAKLGTFAATELTLRPGTYVAVGSRPGFRDVRLEFRVAPEIDMQPVVVRCEEKI